MLYPKMKFYNEDKILVFSVYEASIHGGIFGNDKFAFSIFFLSVGINGLLNIQYKLMNFNNSLTIILTCADLIIKNKFIPFFKPSS
ncbi:hypothetical protein A3K80_06125 [Candidatus Bathyarchaeota archaeon RBG_13_38_9]|nr:MAG: hypothetical protein A3K80_06125 [Candidatus Bathyarchaeota archaeon RBG_13_38_9]